MKRVRDILLVVLLAISLTACAAKNPDSAYKGSILKDGKTISYPAKTDYEAYAMAKSHEPKTYATRSITGIKWMKLKGDITIETRDELDNLVGIQAPKNKFDRAMDSVDRTVPILGSVSKWFFGLDTVKYVAGKLAKDPLVVEQRHDTVNNNNTETVEVVNQQELVIVEKPVIVETSTDNSTNTTNNYNSDEPEPEVEF